MTTRPVAKVKLARRVQVTLALDESSHAILAALCHDAAKSEAEVVADALQCLFVMHPRREEA